MYTIVNSFAVNSTILRHSCYNEASFYLTINIFGVNNTLFRGKVRLLIKFAEVVYKQCLSETLIPLNTAIANVLV